MPGETKRIILEWEEALRFRGGEPGGPSVLIDGDNAEGPGPMLTLLLTIFLCCSIQAQNWATSGRERAAGGEISQYVCCMSSR